MLAVSILLSLVNKLFLDMALEYDILEFIRKNNPSSKHEIYNNISVDSRVKNSYIENGKINIALQNLIEIGIVSVSIDGYEVSDEYSEIAS